MGTVMEEEGQAVLLVTEVQQFKLKKKWEFIEFRNRM